MAQLSEALAPQLHNMAHLTAVLAPQLHNTLQSQLASLYLSFASSIMDIQTLKQSPNLTKSIVNHFVSAKVLVLHGMALVGCFLD